MLQEDSQEGHHTSLSAGEAYVIDGLLTIAASSCGEDIARALRDARLALRSRRPDIPFVWNHSLQQDLMRISDDLAEEPASAIKDAVAFATGKIDILQVDARWSVSSLKLSLDSDITLPVFSTTRSFDDVAQRFGKHLDTHEPLELLIRGHLWIEISLYMLLERYMPRVEVLKSMRLSFTTLLSICDALAAIPTDLVPPIKHLNKLRNRVAHNLDAVLGEQDQQELIDKCGDRLGREGVRRPYPDGIKHVVDMIVRVIRERVDSKDAQARFYQYLLEGGYA